jgi:hypothetical protein
MSDEVEVPVLDAPAEEAATLPMAESEPTAPEEPEAEADPANATEPAATPEPPTGDEWAMNQIIEVNEEAIQQKARVKAKAAELKEEKEILESLQDQLNRLITDAARARKATTPDPERYPLLDGPKAAINEQFSKPEPIAPLPADDFEEHFRRVAVATRIDSLPGLTPKIVEVLAEAGVETVDSWRIRYEAAVASGETIKGITPTRLEKIIEALTHFGDGVLAAWDAEHPEPAEPKLGEVDPATDREDGPDA